MLDSYEYSYSCEIILKVLNDPILRICKNFSHKKKQKCAFIVYNLRCLNSYIINLKVG